MTKKRLLIGAVVVLAASLIAWRWASRAPSESDDPDHPVANAAEPPAAGARVERRSVGHTLAIAGEFKPFQDVDVHAKVAGYIRVIYVAVGALVQAGKHRRGLA